jgi:hypothetical protein
MESYKDDMFAWLAGKKTKHQEMCGTSGFFRCATGMLNATTSDKTTQIIEQLKLIGSFDPRELLSFLIQLQKKWMNSSLWMTLLHT